MSKRLLISAVAIVAAQLTALAQNQKLEIVKLADAAVYSEYRMDPIEGNSLIVVGGEPRFRSASGWRVTTRFGKACSRTRS
jgi:hypothetical protein